MTTYWCDGSPTLTHFYNGWSALFPAWEKAFAVVADHYKPLVTDPALRERIDTFVRQELSHGAAHHKHNERSGTIDLEESEFRRARLAMQRPGNPLWLATMVSIEHIASCYAREFLHKYSTRKPREFKLFVWHSLEEIEHKSLAMDVWNHLGFSRSKLRSAAYSNVTYVWRFTIGYTYRKLREEGQLWKLRTLIDSGVLFKSVLVHCWIPYLRIFRADFHPNDVDDTALVERYHEANQIRQVQGQPSS